MNILFFAIGILIGIIQLLLTKKTVECITGKNNSRLLIFVFIKLAIYACAVSVAYILLRDFFMPLGIGFGAGMIIGAFVNFIVETGKDKSNDKGDDTP
ncbi:MAG: hypothetical protein K5755_06620 [Clostridiales bacterium]|nr:hypothetical protein [Clostridia bacterium]MCR4564288.1 hypothetical protein [Clostridiales bacterium]